ncbi:MAG: hypothetical protein ABH854_05345 [Candidatus Diapherotrites archaeon]|nr:hypothetical protein [Candidatus Micrarchaeota archaeon]MBU1939682.1 hypothetical protein [Candidatus Micrarchaeota archaeon]
MEKEPILRGVLAGLSAVLAGILIIVPLIFIMPLSGIPEGSPLSISPVAAVMFVVFIVAGGIVAHLLSKVKRGKLVKSLFGLFAGALCCAVLFSLFRVAFYGSGLDSAAVFGVEIGVFIGLAISATETKWLHLKKEFTRNLGNYMLGIFAGTISLAILNFGAVFDLAIWVLLGLLFGLFAGVIFALSVLALKLGH